MATRTRDTATPTRDTPGSRRVPRSGSRVPRSGREFRGGEVGLGASGAFVVLDNDRVGAGGHGDVRGVGGGAVVAPAVDDLGAVEEHPDAVVAGGGEAVGGVLVVRRSGPAGR